MEGFHLIKQLFSASWKVTAISVLAVSLAACGNGTAKPASKSNYPDKALSLIAPSGAGGGWDMTARTIAKVLTETKAVDKTCFR
jgi:putative tricarboxylic transport membrane protein